MKASLSFSSQGKCFPYPESTKHTISIWIPKISSSPWMFIKGIKGIDIWNDYIDEWLSHNMICVNLPNSLTVTQYKYSKTQEWIFRNLKAILRLTWQRVAELKLSDTSKKRNNVHTSFNLVTDNIQKEFDFQYLFLVMKFIILNFLNLFKNSVKEENYN